MLLDEVGNAEACELFTVKSFMVHFHLKDEVDGVEGMVPVELEGFGEETEAMLCDRVYPVYAKATMDAVEAYPDDKPASSEKVAEVLIEMNEALAAERTRQSDAKKPEISDSPEAAHLQKAGLDIPKTVAERVVKEHRCRKFREIRPASNNVQ